MTDRRYRLFAFAGGPQDGTYTTNPNQMKVNYPINIDDESMSAASEVPGLPLSTPTLMSGFIQRLKLARICREIADAMPTSLLECEEPSYDLVLDFDRKLQDHLKNLPTYFRLEPQSIKESEEICRQHPFVALHRIVINFSIHARICRLHRFYYLEGSTDSQYAYSRTMCIRSAHRILELRRAMDQVGDKTGYHPARFWKIMQHVYFAALTLATDVSINPDLPDVEDRKSKVLAAYRILESSKAESNALMEGVQKNMQTLLATLESRRPRRQSERSGPSSKRKRADTEHEEAFSDRHLFADSGKSSSAMISREFPSPMVEDRPFGDGMGEDMDSPMGFGMDAFGTDQLWTDFLAIAPEMEGQDWNFFLDNMYTGLQN